MTQGVLPFKYEESKKSRSLTSFSGLLPYVELLYQMDFFDLVKRHVQVHGVVDIFFLGRDNGGSVVNC
jgi:hypothetical protein